MWRAAGLEEQLAWESIGLENSGSSGGGSSGGGSSGAGTSGGGSSGAGSSGAGSSGAGITEEDCHMADVDAANENGFFARWGEPAPQRRGELHITGFRCPEH